MAMAELTDDEKQRLSVALGGRRQVAMELQLPSEVIEAEKAIADKIGKRFGAAHDVMERSRDCLKRWAARYADSEHSRLHVKETKLLMQEIDEWLLND